MVSTSRIFITVFVVILSISSVYNLYSAKSKVVQLTKDNFEKTVLQSKELWFVEFYAPWCGHCKALAPEYEKAAKALYGIINVGAVDADQYKDVGSPYNVNGFPTIKFFGVDKKSPIEFTGERNSNGLIDFAFDQAKKVANKRLNPNRAERKVEEEEEKKEKEKEQQEEAAKANISDEDVFVLTDQNFEQLVLESKDAWFVEFYAPWCGHCKRLAPEWNALATKFKTAHKDIKIAKVDATVEKNIASTYGVTGFPTLKFFPPGRKSSDNVVAYDGGRDGNALETWVVEETSKYKPVPFEQLVNQDIFDEQCKESKGACVILFVPGLLDSSEEERTKYIDTVRTIAQKFKRQPVSFLWAQAGDHFDLEETLAISSGFPAVIAISYKKKVYSSMKASFSKNSIESYVNRLVSGKEAVLPIRKEIPAIKTVTAWQGAAQEKKEDL